MIIKLIAFRIRNFRSIIDTDWCPLASDNISILIGQNESGKTSVLEALQSFYDNNLNEDVLRSDNTYPEVSCKFVIDGKETLKDILKISKLPKELQEIAKNQKYFTLTRAWENSKSSLLYISNDEIYSFYTDKQEKEKKLEEASTKEIEELLTKSDNIFKNLEIAESEKIDAQKTLTENRKTLETAQKQLRRAKKPDLKLIAEKEVNFAQTQYQDSEINFSHKVDEFEKLKMVANEISEKIQSAKNYQGALTDYIKLKDELTESNNKLTSLEHLFELSTVDKDKRSIQAKLNKHRGEDNKIRDQYKQAKAELKLARLIAIKVFNNSMELKPATIESNKELQHSDTIYSVEILGEELFSYIPAFEFFEDFSGLLPNKIDLEDILNENSNVEGYKAARCFLKIAGLDPSFFREKNNRILKQRIETLNSDVTINFQDYWSQNVGKGNKIKLHFELEHYDYTVPEKSGKPYLEFWIKDKQERLYPKQRSRGVRWFLSFYLELKATSLSKKRQRILLIDEPGLSLHARAQEDVLKVFEDLKSSMQIIYTTHSPHLVKPEKIYRILAVQRANEIYDKSETIVFEPSKLSEASADTLTPLYSLMGLRLNNQQLIQSHNIIVPDTITYYYLSWLSKIVPNVPKIHFIPSTEPKNIPILINIFAGWQLKYGVILFGSTDEDLKSNINAQTLLKDDNLICHFKEFPLIEDIFSAIDFKKYILLKRVGITDMNSEYISINNLSRKILATNFANNINDSKITFDYFDGTTQENIKTMFNKIVQLL